MLRPTALHRHSVEVPHVTKDRMSAEGRLLFDVGFPLFPGLLRLFDNFLLVLLSVTRDLFFVLLLDNREFLDTNGPYEIVQLLGNFSGLLFGLFAFLIEFVLVFLLELIHIQISKLLLSHGFRVLTHRLEETDLTFVLKILFDLPALFLFSKHRLTLQPTFFFGFACSGFGDLLLFGQFFLLLFQPCNGILPILNPGLTSKHICVLTSTNISCRFENFRSSCRNLWAFS
mmetsp:Transcript_41653/g.99861  ORF Transcript_41653/g.99861 Transcript_41653/m.99861 type:complete len:229 (-) Transcript_41653:1811-2497(-)